jgi:hypothetical protein
MIAKDSGMLFGLSKKNEMLNHPQGFGYPQLFGMMFGQT